MEARLKAKTSFGGLWAARTVEWAREWLELSSAEIGVAVGAAGRTVTRWAQQSARPRPSHRARIEKLNELRHLLNTVFDSPESAQEWLHTPVPTFRGRTPHSLVRRGQLDKVIATLAALESGAFV